jgi:hypothetical protein
MSEHHPEETMAIVASDLDPDDLPDELIDELLAGAGGAQVLVDESDAAAASEILANRTDET